jgi:RHS repeat-associated protein
MEEKANVRRNEPRLIGRYVSTSFRKDYDGFDRQTKTTYPDNTFSSYAYDVAGNLTSVTDPLGKVTQEKLASRLVNNHHEQSLRPTGIRPCRRLGSAHPHRPFGPVWPLLPASRRDTYDGQGNLATRVDARGVTSTSTYDALDRITSLVHSKSGSPSETVTYTFDDTAVPFSKGRLTKVQDTAGVTSYAYDAFGRVTNKTQIVTGLTRSISYAFNALGQLSTMTLPSGAVVTYTYTHGRVSGIGINGSALISATSYEPAIGNSGAISGWVWGNGLKSYRDYDLDGRIATLEHKNGTTLLKNTLNYDSASRITGISNDQQPAKSQAYAYDTLDRLTQTKQGANVATPDITQSQTYDANGNRLTQSKGLLNIVAGTYSYNLANRLNEVKQGATVIGSYRFNAFGQRLAKTTASGTQHYVYDEAGQLAGEYDGSGTLVQETVWLENTPVATLRPKAGGGVDVYYVHSDHLNTPRVVTRPIDNKKVWAWHSMPFGETAPDENPEGLGVFAYNLRFPGQEWEAELGLSQNWFRTYAADTGRYVQSDPIGLRGGLNTFGYVGGDPLSKIDPEGLQFAPPGPAPGPGTGPWGIPTPWSPRPPSIPDGLENPPDGTGWRSPRLRVPSWFPNWAKPAEQCKDEADEKARCEKVLVRCRTQCTDIYVTDPSKLPGTGSDMPGRIRRCIRECMKADGCDDF